MHFWFVSVVAPYIPFFSSMFLDSSKKKFIAKGLQDDHKRFRKKLKQRSQTEKARPMTSSKEAIKDTNSLVWLKKKKKIKKYEELNSMYSEIGCVFESL